MQDWEGRRPGGDEWRGRHTWMMMAFRPPVTSASLAEVMYRSRKSAFSSVFVASRSNRACGGCNSRLEGTGELVLRETSAPSPRHQ